MSELNHAAPCIDKSDGQLQLMPRDSYDAATPMRIEASLVEPNVNTRATPSVGDHWQHCGLANLEGPLHSSLGGESLSMARVLADI